MSKKSILQTILAYLAKKALATYKPVVIGITGSVGKTSTREAIFAVLQKKYRVRKPEKNYNNEIGLPLTILGLPHAGRNILKWIWVLFGEWIRITLRMHTDYPEVLVLEYGIDAPGDMQHLITIAPPTIAVVTAIGDMPVHVEFFKSPEALIAEKAKLVHALPIDGYAIFFHDDFATYGMKDKTKAHVLTYGTDPHADIKIVNYRLLESADGAVGVIPDGIAFKIEHGGHMVPMRLHAMFGMPQAYAATAAAAVGVVMNMNLVEISDALREYVSPPGRLRLLKGIKHSFVLDDSYNASPEAMRAALDALKELPAKRKIAVLGDMLELGTYSEQAHRAIGDQVAEFADILLCVGARAKFIADEAMTRGVEAHARRLEVAQVMRFDSAQEAGEALDPLIQEGDLILVKGSQGMRMEKAVEEIMAEPELAKDLLVRQDVYWKSRQ